MSGDVVLRWLRALALTCVFFISALSGHAAAGDARPPTALLLPLFLIAAVAMVPFVGVPVGPARVTVLLVAGQATLHLAFQLLAVPSTADHPSTASAATHVHGGGLSEGLLSSVAGGAHLPMVLMHLAASVVVGLWLSAGERAVGALLSLAARPWGDAWRSLRDAARLEESLLVVARPRVIPSRDVRFADRHADALGDVWRRGPPAHCF